MPCHHLSVPRFEAFRALRFAPSLDLNKVCAPPYDVLNQRDRAELASLHHNNIVNIDLPIGVDPYLGAADSLKNWAAEGVLITDAAPSLTIYRMTFTDSLGMSRQTVGVIGALEVVDLGAGGVLPHEQTTPKAKTDRLDLTRATDANLSPVWGLSMGTGLSAALEKTGESIRSMTDSEGVTHTVETVSDSRRIDEITRCISPSDVIIADGHHRYAIGRSYRDEVRERTGRTDTDAELTLAYVNELVDEQLSVAAIHRLYQNTTATDLLAALGNWFEISDASRIDQHTLSQMQLRGSMFFVQRDQTCKWLTPKAGAFDNVRDLDSARLEHALDGVVHEVHYQHGIEEVLTKLRAGDAVAAILIRPVSVAEIRRTATEGLLMPPKSTFFTPKLRTGLVLRDLNTR